MHRLFTLRLLGMLLAALCGLGLGLALVTPAVAQGGIEWRERPGAIFQILYAPGDELEAERYAAWADAIYEEIAAAFGVRTATPLTLRLYPTSESYYQANPAARQVPGVVAHADFRRRELVVIVERTAGQSEEEVRNNVRHELTHIVIAELSDNRLNAGFQEGVAQYLEQPSAELDRRMASLGDAFAQGRLLAWSAFDERAQVYGQPELSYPQALAVVAFLVDREGFARLREFVVATGEYGDYRAALEQVYATTPEALETAWRDWLPGYLAGSYRRSALASYDLGPLRDLVGQGSYATAREELLRTLDWLHKQVGTQPPEVLAEAEALLLRSEEGLRAEQLAEDARQALATADYERAGALIAGARTLYDRLGDRRQVEVLTIYTERVERGLRASADLLQADALAQALRYPQARTSADRAATEFAALGDPLRRDHALRLRTSLDQRQRLVGMALVSLGIAGVVFSLFGRFFARPDEIW